METVGLVVGIIAGVIAIIGGLAAFMRWLFRPRGEGGPPTSPEDPPGPRDSFTIQAKGRALTLQNVQVTGNLNIYVDGLPQAKKPEVRDHFQEGVRLQEAERHGEAVAEFEKAFAAAEDESQRFALQVLIGNSYLEMGRLPEAEGHYLEARDIGNATGKESSP